MKPAFPSHACSIAYLDGLIWTAKRWIRFPAGRFTATPGSRKDHIRITVQSTNTGGLTCGRTKRIRGEAMSGRASVGLEILTDLGGTPPFRVQPDQNSQATNLHGTRGKKSHLPQAGIIYGRYVGRPYRPPCREQAAEALFCRNAERISPATGLASRPVDGRVHRRPRQIDIAFASSVPIYELALFVFTHCFYSATKGAARARYNRNLDGSESGGRSMKLNPSGRS
jgi:hypothetical protein